MADEMINKVIDEAEVVVPTGDGGTAKVEIDYDKIASLVEGKQKVAEDTVLKSYFKQQGLSADEMNSAIEMFKKDKASKEPNIDELNATIKQKDGLVSEAMGKWLEAETKLAAYQMAPELGIDQNVLPYVLKMADTSEVIDDGKVDTDKLKASIEAVLKDVPQLKAEPEAKVNGFKIGADKDAESANVNAELASIFGVAKK
jgi:hypothetical protein